jgi:hypothetical protein
MSDLTYKEPLPPSRPFAVGDVVEVLDRQHNVLSKQMIVKANAAGVATECGRHWTKNGWFRGEIRIWPFPSIRHAP